MTEQNAENANIFSCQKCDFVCHKKSEWIRHISTRKHQTSDISVTEVTAKNATLTCSNCQKVYKSRNGLWIHKKKCSKPNNAETCKTEDEQCLEEPDETDLEPNSKEIIKMMKMQMIENQEIRNLIIELLKK